MKPIAQSELILNADGSIYHLNLKPADIATTIITVGDPDRVTEVSKHFDTIEFKQHKREFKTHTGTYKGKRITVISTGIGTDNIDIVFNELDALVNIDFDTRTIKKEHEATTKTNDAVKLIKFTILNLLFEKKYLFETKKLTPILNFFSFRK